tara:strand:+ start:10202 stop:11617 length:1416 start_codon:yes stop_codon:yes gene_type:complete
MTGKSIVSIDTQWGDTGKRKVNSIVVNAHTVARCNGGNNSGGKYKEGKTEVTVHSIPLPSNPNCDAYIGSGCVIPAELTDEINNIEAAGISIKNRLYISAEAPIIQPHHKYLDAIQGGKIGTTKKGIGPCYSGIAERMHGDLLKHIPIGEFFENQKLCTESAFESLSDVFDQYQLKLPSRDNVNLLEIVTDWADNLQKLESYVVYDPLFMHKRLDAGETILLALANGALLDPIKGTTPNCTSSRITTESAYVGGDLHSRNHHKTIGVAKAIMTRVGNGPFPSEYGGFESEEYCDFKNSEGNHVHIEENEWKLHNPHELLKSENPFEIGIAIRMLSKEYGATTKRPRRVGALDLVALKQVCQLNRVDELYITKFDDLRLYSNTNLPGIPITGSYLLDNKQIEHMPTSDSQLRRCIPVTDHLEHITEDISKIRNYGDLPGSAREAIFRMELYLDTKIRGIGVGPDVEDFIYVP